MEQRFNKPRVFLSHSKKDSAFIEKLADDLRRCQIEPWLDTYEIRHGKSWLDSIFEYGLPTCDAILVYFTESSMSSAVVKKEMDAGVLQTLNDNNVAFLPYVSDAKIRPSLRADIQALQTSEWNDENYSALLPRVVAEIWRSYLERTVASATKDERLKRVEAELQLEKVKNQSDDFFSPSENAEFEFIWNSYNKTITITIISGIRTKDHDEYKLSMNLASVIARIGSIKGDSGREEYSEYSEYNVWAEVKGFAMKLLKSQDIAFRDNAWSLIEMEGFPELAEGLLMYGLIENAAHRWVESTLVNRMIFTKKIFRFRYWLTCHQKLPDSIVMEVVKDD